MAAIVGLRQRVCVWVERLERSFVLAHHRILYRLTVGPVPLEYWERLWRSMGAILPFANPLVPAETVFVSDALRPHPLLTPLLHGCLRTPWALDGQTLVLLWQMLWRDRPGVVVECGAGISTILLAEYALQRLDREQVPVLVLSLEQDANVKRDVENRLADFGAQSQVVILHAPLTNEGRYDIAPATIEHALRGRKADMLLIDGPFGPAGCRQWTVPLLAPHCRPGARWVLDDAFRDGELRILHHWNRRSDVTVEGIYPVDKGFATGLVTDGSMPRIR